MQQTRERILDTTARLFRRYGYNGTGIKEIVEQANAPFGSIYHHFPGGKEQIGDEVIRRAGAMYFDLVTAVYDAAPDPVSAVGDVFRGAAAVLAATDYVDACPIETVALEVASSNDTLLQATADVFESWITGATERFVAGGVPADHARPLAIALIAALEGAFVLSRAMRTTEALEVTGKAVATVAAGALPPSA